MSIADPASLDATPTPRRRHAAVTGLVGGPYPNLGTPRPAPAHGHALVGLRAVARALPTGGPYPNLSARP